MFFVVLPAVGLFTLGTLVAIVWLVKRAINIAPPDTALVITGPARPGRGGPTFVRGGRFLQKPLIELVDTLDLRPLEVQVLVPGEHVEISGHLTAVVKIASTEPGIGRAARLLLGLPRAEVARIAEQVLQHHLTCLLHSLAPVEVLEDQIAFREKLIDEAEHDLDRLGLVIDTVTGDLRR
jgi:flotillin